MKYTTGLLAVLLVIASILLISNTIRLSLFSRRREIQVMKLVGATDWFIRWPFVLEGIIVGALGALLAVLLLGVMKVALVDPLVSDFALLAAPDTIGFGVLVAILLCAGIARQRDRLGDLAAPLPAGLRTGRRPAAPVYPLGAASAVPLAMPARRRHRLLIALAAFAARSALLALGAWIGGRHPDAVPGPLRSQLDRRARTGASSTRRST